MTLLNLHSVTPLTCLAAVPGTARRTDAAELGDLVDTGAAVGAGAGRALVDV